jgi:hypothetical protein
MNLSKLFLSLLAASCLMQTGIASAQSPAVQTENVQAQWQPHKLNFQFMGFRTYYSCTSIEDRLEQLLRDLGAKPDVRVSATGCSPAEISRTITARIHLSMPADAGSTVTTDNPVFPAQRKTVTLAIHSSGRQIGAGDCELLEQVRDQLLPALQLEIVKDDLRCFPGQEVLGNRTMQIAALVPVVDGAIK